MIQRIQTLFLLAATGLLVAMFFIPMCYVDSEGSKIFYHEYMPLFSLLMVSAILSIINIFSYKNRLRQIRTCNLNSIILLGFQIYIAVLIFTRTEMRFSITAVFPAVAAILTFIGMRYVARDEAMVRASSSLRDYNRKKRK
ncbi:MAG: DUF4293 domain-containing protein [Bacteroidales bacterium]|nr:DUF4293 domain-containing protein [Bacteroidales bacterium]